MTFGKLCANPVNRRELRRAGLLELLEIALDNPNSEQMWVNLHFPRHLYLTDVRVSAASSKIV